jgi:serine/threonine-protein kinase
VKVVDFGLVKTLNPGHGEIGITQVNSITGTPMYLAPEAISSPENLDGRSDIYSLGAVMYFMLTGQHVFNGSTVVEVLTKHMLETPVPPSTRVGRDVPADLEALVMACLAKDRAARPASAAALRDALLACADARNYDVVAAREWWQVQGAALRTAARTTLRAVGHATTMAIDIKDRPFMR